jgi:hypothetical protein
MDTAVMREKRRATKAVQGRTNSEIPLRSKGARRNKKDKQGCWGQQHSRLPAARFPQGQEKERGVGQAPRSNSHPEEYTIGQII